MQLNQHFPANAENFLKNRTILITGGAGFIGSNLAHRLAHYDCKIIILDNLNQKCGGNLKHLEAVKHKITIETKHMCDKVTLKRVLPQVDFLFNLAGNVNHMESMINPEFDLEVNCVNHLRLLEFCKKLNPDIKIIFTSTRGVYGRPQKLPVNEQTEYSPIDINGIHKMTTEKYHLLFYKHFGLKTSCLRLTNTYGPFHTATKPGLGIINWWIKQIVLYKQIVVYKPGQQIRDVNYIDDVVNALIMTMIHHRSVGNIYNLSGVPISILEIGKLIVKLYGKGELVMKDFPPDAARIDIGDYTADSRRIQSDIDWKPMVSLEEGVIKTLDYYEKNKD